LRFFGLGQKTVYTNMFLRKQVHFSISADLSLNFCSLYTSLKIDSEKLCHVFGSRKIQSTSVNDTSRLSILNYLCYLLLANPDAAFLTPFRLVPCLQNDFVTHSGVKRPEPFKPEMTYRPSEKPFNHKTLYSFDFRQLPLQV